MVSFLRIAGISVLVLAAIAYAVPQPQLNKEAKEQYENHHQYIRSTYQQPLPDPNSRVEYYSHLLSEHTDGENQAWSFSQLQGNGPAHSSWGRHNRNAYVTTRIPSESDLGRRWGLGSPMIGPNGERHNKDIYAFWHVNSKRVKLMRLDAWQAGGLMPQIMTWRNTVNHLNIH